MFLPLTVSVRVPLSAVASVTVMATTMYAYVSQTTSSGCHCYARACERSVTDSKPTAGRAQSRSYTDYGSTHPEKCHVKVSAALECIPGCHAGWKWGLRTFLLLQRLSGSGWTAPLVIRYPRGLCSIDAAVSQGLLFQSVLFFTSWLSRGAAPRSRPIQPGKAKGCNPADPGSR